MHLHLHNNLPLTDQIVSYREHRKKVILVLKKQVFPFQIKLRQSQTCLLPVTIDTFGDGGQQASRTKEIITPGHYVSLIVNETQEIVTLRHYDHLLIDLEIFIIVAVMCNTP